MIDTQSAPGAWAETLASPSCKIEVLHTHTTKVGALDVNFTFGRITPKHRPAVSDFNRDGGVNGPHAQDQGAQLAKLMPSQVRA